MATTPEGAVKKMVKTMLSEYGNSIYYFMPVQGGFGASTLDFLGCHIGRFFAIETKAPGKHPTDRQTMIMNSMRQAKGRVFIIDGERDLMELRAWLNGMIE